MHESHCCYAWEKAVEWGNNTFDKPNQNLDEMPVFCHEKQPLSKCPHCGEEITYNYITDAQILAEKLNIGSCDFCDEDNRILEYLEDGFGFHVMN